MAKKKKVTRKPKPRVKPQKKKVSKPPFNTPFLNQFKAEFLKGPPTGWPDLPFDPVTAREEIPLMIRILLEISDVGALPGDIPPSPLRARLESFLAAKHWTDDRVRGMKPLLVRHKEIARIADMLMRIYHVGDGTGGSATEWPPP
jgi:hypothetical protein